MNPVSTLSHPLVKALLDLSTNPIVITDRFTTEVLFASQASFKLFGKDFVSRRISDDFNQAVRPLLLDGKPIQDETNHPALLVKEFGSLQSEIRWATPLGIKDLRIECSTLDTQVEGRWICVYSISDITNIKAINRRKFSEMNHEIKNFLGIIRGFAEVLQTENDDIINQKNTLEIIARNAEHANDLVERHLNDAKNFESDEKSYAVFNLFQITQEIALAHTKHAIRNGVKITLKPFFTSDTVYSKRRNVQQIITNLISNAVKYTETGVIEIAVVDLGTDFLAVDVKDSGVGIDQENQKRLFEAFSQAQNHEDLNSRGYGLGLHIVKKMSQELGGDVVLVESAVNIGSTFRFKLPRVAHRKTSETF